MIDLHCHILFDTDDGARKIDNSINILKEAYDAGFTKICCTPHYVVPQYTKNKTENADKLEKIKAKLEEEKIDIELCLGNEIYITDNIEELIQNGTVSTIADTKYILVELPITQKLLNAEEIIEDLIFAGYKVILAHPERYVYVQKNIKYLDNFIEMGAYLQGNYESLIGKYGRESEKTIKKLLKAKKIDLLATDTHRENSTYTKMNKILKKLKHYAKKEYYEYVTKDFQEDILKNV